MRVVVIGAGVIGASVAFRLAEGGAELTVIERDRVGGGTSGASFAWTNSNNKTPRAYHDLNVAGMRAHSALRDELGATPWWHGGGSIEWEAEGERAAQAEKIDRLRDWGYAAEWITRRDLAELEPGLDPRAAADAPIAYYPEEGWLDPVPYAHAMLDLASRRGAKLLTGVAVTEVIARAGRVCGVRTSDGAILEADRVVNCAGRWADELVVGAAPSVPLAPTAGLLIYTPPVATGLSRILRTPECDLRPDGADRLVLIREATGEAAAPLEDPGPASAEANALVAAARRLLPGIGGAHAEATRLGIRPIPRDGYSAVGPMPGPDGYYVAVTHSGVTLSAFLGQAVADEVLGRRTRAELEMFRPVRFFNDSGAET